GDPGELRRRLRDIWASKSKTQPMAEASAGCVFKNPEGGSAGALIDRAGLKGCAVGGARVSQVHANFIVVQSPVTAEDIFTLIGTVRREVARQFGVELDLEIEVWGRRRVRAPDPVL
ncbi:MAG TPA: UDP-N-acetylenolpyruvoylglucosamine reductase, partial [Phycisphaerae bacterium]|nr:UDP-N-acetylenolpyruvoylglucosamine reductase [Phycisphaerae bacterium]